MAKQLPGKMRETEGDEKERKERQDCKCLTAFLLDIKLPSCITDQTYTCLTVYLHQFDPEKSQFIISSPGKGSMQFIPTCVYHCTFDRCDSISLYH